MNGKVLALRPVIIPMVEAGLSYSEIARRLNERGMQTVNGRRFRAQQVKAIHDRLQNLVRVSAPHSPQTVA